MNTTHTLAEWLNLMMLGGLMGGAGQVIRQIAGLKKMLDGHPGSEFKARLDAYRLFITWLIGAVAGMLAVLVTDMPPDGKAFPPQILIGLLTAGYAGTDFIESFMQRHPPPQSQKPKGSTE